MNYNRYPILKIFIPFMCGIVVSCWVYLPQKTLLFAAPFFVALLPILALLLHFWHYKWQVAATLLFQITFFFVGFFLANTRFYSHLSNNQENLLQNNLNWVVRITDFPAVTEKSVKLIADIESTFDGQPLHKKALLYFKKDSMTQLLCYGDKLLLHAKITPIASPKNPYSFDYKKYMQKKGIFFTAYIQTHAWQKAGSSRPPPLRYMAKQLQQYFAQQLAAAGMSGDEYSVITAILLGDDDTMNAEMRQSYASAGVSHILSVSGMHVGIIFMFLSFLLKPMDLSRKTAIIKALLLLITIWLYAHITGLSPSVRRAAAMFTFVTIGGLLRRNTDIFHSLFTSCFVLLLFNPLLLFDVGFQLSYLAVAGIVTFQPHILRIWKPKAKIANYFWQLTAVSAAAQLATFPLSIYYFGQFPNYFLIANLAVIMLSSVVLITGIVTLALSFSVLL
ncbi:MAG: ComEC family competence protein, partial [Bacteroidales bacterium]|nr:ComEC family competence protein [Bacteroidales bacterium]